MFIETIYKDSRKVKIDRNYISKYNLMSAEPKGYVTRFIYFLDLLWVRYNFAKFHHWKICVTDFRCPWAPPRRTTMNSVKTPLLMTCLVSFVTDYTRRHTSKLLSMKWRLCCYYSMPKLLSWILKFIKPWSSEALIEKGIIKSG